MKKKEGNLIMKEHRFLHEEIKSEEIDFTQFKHLIKIHKKIDLKIKLISPHSKKEKEFMEKKFMKKLKGPTIQIKDSAIKMKNRLLALNKDIKKWLKNNTQKSQRLKINIDINP